jgi:hypothetical protein
MALVFLYADKDTVRGTKAKILLRSRIDQGVAIKKMKRAKKTRHYVMFTISNVR